MDYEEFVRNLWKASERLQSIMRDLQTDLQLMQADAADRFEELRRAIMDCIFTSDDGEDSNIPSLPPTWWRELRHLLAGNTPKIAHDDLIQWFTAGFQ